MVLSFLYNKKYHRNILVLIDNLLFIFIIYLNFFQLTLILIIFFTNLYIMQVNSKNNIKQLTEEFMDLKSLTEGSKNIHKRKNEENSHFNPKKIRQK